MEINVLLRLLVAHLLGDFILQPGSRVTSKEAKKISSGSLYLHIGVITIIAYLLLWDWSKWYIPLIIGLTHLLIDIWKCYRKNSLLYFLADQAAHILVILIIWQMCYFTFGEVTAKFNTLLQDNRTWLLIIGYYVVIWPLGIAIGKATERWQRLAKMGDGGLDKAGIWIGRCERILVLTFIITGQYTALGFLMTAKSILRFTDKDEMTQKKTEYVLVGTLMSFASAAIIGVIISACLMTI
ncbi:DUF3307 domain-containing protein [Mucilaginibacter sp. UYCu711]|uniref:DUF3307 domain-containing protein n=1 Tax=Mucilaginibacter sp. UYCu711 TaxID=3156339 RepID=UPI003D24316F